MARRKLKGKAIPWTDKEIEALILVSEADIERAAVMWRTNAPDEAEDLLDAEPLPVE